MRLVRYRGIWAAAWTEAGRTVRVSLRTRDRDQAQARLHELARRPVGESVGEIMAAYLADLDARAARPDRAHDAWKALSSHFAGLYPAQVDRAASRLYARRRAAQGRQAGTVAKELGTLRAALRWHDPRTPAVVELPASPAPRDRYLTRPELDALLAACRHDHLRLFVVLALATAGRAGAILELTWDRVDFRRGLVKLGTAPAGQRRKGRATVPMNARLRAALEGALEVSTGTAEDRVVEWAGRPVKSVKRAFAAACARAGLKPAPGQPGGVTPHTLRHTAAVWLAEAGTPMPEIAAFLGHDDARTTERIYAKFSPGYLARAAKALE